MNEKIDLIIKNHNSVNKTKIRNIKELTKVGFSDGVKTSTNVLKGFPDFPKNVSHLEQFVRDSKKPVNLEQVFVVHCGLELKNLSIQWEIVKDYSTIKDIDAFEIWSIYIKGFNSGSRGVWEKHHNKDNIIYLKPKGFD